MLFLYAKVGVKFKKSFSSLVAIFTFLAVVDPLFFTSSKSLIHPYTLPVMVPVALIIVHFWEEVDIKTR